MTRNRTIAPARFTAADGTPVVRVPLANGSFATVDAADFDRLLAAGVSPFWTANVDGSGQHRYVRVSRPGVAGKLATVARLILEPPRHVVIRYRDGDRMNLRRCNLTLDAGYAPGQSTPEQAARRRQRQEAAAARLAENRVAAAGVRT